MEPIGAECLKKLHSFMCGLPIKKLSELLEGGVDSACIVLVWFDSVVEGVDMWFNDDQSKDMAKFRMKMKVKHGEHVAVFAVFDQEVKKLAMETCPILISMISVECIGESCSLYSDETECFYGDAYLCKVQERDPVDFDDLPAFDVLSICSEAGVVNMFFDQFIPDAEKFFSIINIDVPACDSIKELEDCGFNHYSYVGSDDSDDAAGDCVNAAILA
ncbi:hypothetical protein P8452_22160 [Trifolium repens]|nr:hypothetical protein P8452_22160 [Trifolium repens]